MNKQATSHANCPLYKKCGGCQMQNLDYPSQLRWKQSTVDRLVGRFCRVAPIIGMELPFHYRNKVQAAFGVDRSRRIISGVYQSSSHRIVPVDSCMIEDQLADAIIVTVRGLLPQFKLLPYDEDTGRGWLRHVLVRRGFASGEIMVVLVTGVPMFPSKANFVGALRQAHPEITTIVHNVNNQQTSLVLGERQHVLYGNGYIEDTLCGCIFRISPRSFYQINPLQTEVLYGRAMKLAQLKGTERVVDAYCGIGTIGLVASRHCASVIGVELNRDAVRDAISNCKRNGITNARFYQGDAGEFMTEMEAAGEGADVVFMDPPRSGSDAAFLTSVLKLSPARIVYISCNPETLARDLAQLTDGSYRVTAIQPVDMFPYTHHVECCCLLEKQTTGKPIVNGSRSQ